ncbi:MAG: T9SS type A sorting domain-containing protein [Calditrichaceae bacterium]|nr:T9SS type A sorting domain-containing protein [Calditrichia bacterium]NUQ43536.1 T9SS type A sorting domain-containing protein [Calditrichaceae bacterium]
MNRRSFFLLAALIGALAYSVYAGDPAERRKNVHTGNQIRSTFFNYGLIGRINSVEDFGLEWPINSGHFYIGDLSFMVGAEARLPNGDIIHSVEVADGPRGNNEYNPNDPNDFWGWEPLAGFANPNQPKVAMSHQPDTWPLGWQGWLGIPGYGGIADQESFFVVDDGTDREFFFSHGFLPDSANPARYGMGWRVKTRSYQFSDPFLENALVFQYTIHNEGTTFYPKTFFSMIVGTTIGGDGDTGDDNAGYDLENGLMYAWDYDNIGNTGWSPVGYLGIALLETPGIDFDGIDNDGDGAGGSGEVIGAAVLAPKVLQIGDPIVLIDYSGYGRTVSTMPAGGVTFTFNGVTYQVLPGDTLRETPNGVDDNLNGLIDELTEIPGNNIDDNGNGLIDEDNPHWGKKYINYFTGAGLDNPQIDESAPGDADEIGLTGFYHFAPFNVIRLRDDQALWEANRPGYFHNPQQNTDGDFIFGSGYFPSVPGDSQQVAVGIVMGIDLANLRANANLLRQAYRENFTVTPFPIQANFPAPGSVIGGNYLLNVNADSGNANVLIDIEASNDFGANYQTVAQNQPNALNYNWQTANHPDGVFYKLKAIVKLDSFLTTIVSDSVFTIDNPGNGAPEIMFVEPLHFSVRDTFEVHWLGGDPEGQPVDVSLYLSIDAGNNWQLVGSNLPPSGSFIINSLLFPNTSYALLKLEISDGELSNLAIFPHTFSIWNTLYLLSDSLLVHARGNSDGVVRVMIADSSALTGHIYRLSFTENTPQSKVYHVFDLTDSIYKAQNVPVNHPYNTVFDGFQLKLFDVEEIAIAPEETGWSNPQVNVPYQAQRFSAGLIQGVKYPADYEVIFDDEIIDTSGSYPIGGIPAPPATPVNFTLWNFSENRAAEFNLYQVGSKDRIVIMEEINTEFQPTWLIEFDYTNPNLILPTEGDTFYLEILEPFTENDVYWFSSEAFVVGNFPVANHLPTEFSLQQNYPNPFNPSTTIAFALPRQGKVKLEIFDILGRRVRSLLDQPMQPGRFKIEWDGRNAGGEAVASGVYFYRLVAGDFVGVKKMVLLR